MAVVTTNSQAYAPSTFQFASGKYEQPQAVYASAHQKAIIGTIAVNNGDSIASIYNIGYIPTNAVIDPSSLVYGSGIAGLTAMSFGFAASPLPANKDTWAAQPNALVNAADWHTAASFSLVSAVSEANYGQQVWQLLGLTEDPGGVVGLYASLGAAATAAGTLQFIVKYFDGK